jgi:carboxyl-terminal processing protease
LLLWVVFLWAQPGSELSAATNKWEPVNPGPVDGRIAFVAAKMLEKLHYTPQKLNDTLSGKFLDTYLEALDPQHIHFTQVDLAEFESYRTNLDDLTITSTGISDVDPAYEIYNRFMKRLGERVAFAGETLKSETFKFDTEDRILINRKDLPYPKDLQEARALWHERLRFEYLQERLGKLDAKKKAEKEPKSASPSKNGVKKTEPEEITETLNNRYHRNLRMFQDWDHDDVLQLYLTTLAHIYDPHSDYFGHAQLEQFAIGMNLSLFGIGAELKSEDGYCTIQRLLPGGPAVKSKKMKEKDRIVAVAQSNQPPVDVYEMNLTKAVQLIRGPKGSQVRLTVIPAGEDSSVRKEVVLIRDEIPLEDQAAKAKIIDLPTGQGQTVRLGVIDLPSFYATFDPRGRSEQKSTTQDVIKLIGKLKQENVKGIILDLRRNGGGSLEEAIQLTGLFIKKGPVVQVRDGDGKVQEDSDKDAAILYDGPLVVMTSRFSASASEIVAGALQDYGRALIVGDISTHGKGTVQSVNKIAPYMQLSEKVLTNDPGAVKLTIKKFYRAGGGSTQLRGVSPDIVLPSVFNESKDFGESSLDNPMPWDTIDSSKFQPVAMVEPYLTDLKNRSEERVDTDQEFGYSRADIQHYKKNQSDKTISLNEAQRIKEKEEADARQKARKEERLARAERPETVYEITLKNVSLPGLPPPMERTNTLARAEAGKGGSIAAGTNATAAVDPPDSPATEDEEVEPAVPAYDANMIETQRILVDYLDALSARREVARTVK